MILSELSDEDVWLMVKQNNGFAFKALFDRFWEKLYVYAFNRLRSEPDAQDIVQEIMISLWARRAVLSIETTVAAYLHTAVQYEILTHFSKAALADSRKQEFEKNVLPAFVTYMDPLHIKELQALAEEEIARLPEKMQKVYRLRHEENLSVEEIALLLNVSPQTVRNQLTSSYHKLRKHLKEAILAAIFLQGF